ncbi:exported hypothetical protein [Nitrosotalea sinensis]|uniref:Uncharacterized protein n=1 Tax=Nitrosotalea sinensis TaxID=1499975 RepID=A0A2H1EGQ6_9ARCH|nr:exported hypothetical protein [Candidatus Nitrosotalea sinensis]
MISLKSSSKLLLSAVSALVLSLILGSLAPAMAQTTPQQNLEKRNYYYLDDQHLTALYGNDKVCGDHLCAPGEWAKLQENLNKAQIHPSNNTKITIPPTTPITPTTNKTSTTTTVPANQTVTTPPPVTNPPPATNSTSTTSAVSPSVCMAVKTALGNSTSSDIVAKIMNDLGCK